MLNCPLRANLNRSCLRWTHSSTSWDHVHSIQFTLHFRGALSSFFRDRFHKQHQTVKVLENILRRKELLIWRTFSLTSISILNFLVLDMMVSLPQKVLLVLLQSTLKHAETRWVSMKYVAVWCSEQWPKLKEYSLKFLPKQEFQVGNRKYSLVHSFENLFCRPNYGGLGCLCCFCCARFRGVFIVIPKEGTCDSSSASCNALSSLWSPKKIHPWC